MPDRRYASRHMIDRARSLRQSETPPEDPLWLALRNSQIGGMKFRRQHPIGPYIVDFYCPTARLIIELDGDQHGDERHIRYDSARTAWLMDQGYTVLRFANGEFLKNPQLILDAVAHELEVRDVPLPEIRRAIFDPPSRGG